MSRESDEQYTPRWIFETLDITFDLDVCAPKGGVEWIPAANHYSIEDDGLTQDWYGTVWMNPPFSQATPWMQRFMSYRNGIALSVMSKSKWFNNLWSSDAAIVPLPSSLKFVLPDGTPNSIFNPICLSAFGHDCIEAVNRIGLARVAA